MSGTAGGLTIHGFWNTHPPGWLVAGICGQAGVCWRAASGNQWGPSIPQQRVGWQPSRFLTDRTEAERAF